MLYRSDTALLIQDPSVLFVVIKTRQAEAAQKAVEVASAAKRLVSKNI